MAFDMSEPCKFPSLDSCKKSFLWTHKEVGLELEVEDAEKFPDRPPSRCGLLLLKYPELVS